MEFRRRMCLLPLLMASASVTGCGGMNRAVGVLPNTAEDLAKRTAPFRADRRSERPSETER